MSYLILFLCNSIVGSAPYLLCNIYTIYTIYNITDCVCARSQQPLQGKVDSSLVLEDLSECDRNSPDIIVEVAHPDITR